MYKPYHNLLILSLLFLLPNLIKCSCPNIISRSGWGATKAKSRVNLRINPPPYVVIHHSETPNCFTEDACKKRVKNIQYFHQNTREWEDIGYNFLVGGDGNVYEGRGWGIHGAHVPRFNSNSIGICVLGSFTNEIPPQAQLNAVKLLIECGVENGYIQSDYHLIGHRQGKATTCPGNSLFNEISNWSKFDSSIRP